MINSSSLLIESAPSYIEGVRYLKTKYRNNKSRFISRFIEPNKKYLQMDEVKNYQDICDFYVKLWDRSDVTEFSFKQAFEIKNNEFRALVFSIIDVPEMIKELGSKMIKVEGKELVNKTYNKYTDKFINEPFTQIYELHEVNSEKLGLTETLYAIKCWCTSTNDEHWLWVDLKTGASHDPLKAIASTCKVYKSMIGNIKHIIRQGDVFLFEMLDENIRPIENEEVVSLDADTYFSLIKSQS